MPIYEYACKNCGHTLDELQKISDDPLLDCPECGQPQLKRLISAPRFRLKGAGWYETDFKKDNQRNLSKGEGDTASSNSKSDDSSSASSAGDKSNGDATPAKTAEKATESKTTASKPVESKTVASKSTDSKTD